MKYTRFGIMLMLALIASISRPVAVGASTSTTPNQTIIFTENFDSATLPTSLGLGSQSGATLELIQDPAQTRGGSGKSLKATYPVQPLGSGGAVFAWGGVDLKPYNTDNVYIRFWAKMPGATHGLKFVKIFGQNDGQGGYANSTFGLDYTGVDVGSFYTASFGDGSASANDTQNILLLDGTYPNWAGRSYGLPGFSDSTPQSKAWASSDWGTGWHLFEFAVKFNSGSSAATEKNDGAYLARIDGKVYLEARGIFNRHYSNLPLDNIQILGWSQRAGNTAAPAFEIWYDDIEVKVGDWDFLKTATNTRFDSVGTQDGQLLESAENSSVGGSRNSSASTFSLGDDSENRQSRGVLSFSTGSLPDNATVTGVTLKLRRQSVVGGGNPISIFKGLMVDIQNGFFGSAASLQNVDFSAPASHTYGPFSPALSGGFYNINLTSAKGLINKLGPTQIRLRFKLDDNNNAVANLLNLYSGEAALTNRPQLLVTYSVP